MPKMLPGTETASPKLTRQCRSKILFKRRFNKPSITEVHKFASGDEKKGQKVLLLSPKYGKNLLVTVKTEPPDTYLPKIITSFISMFPLDKKHNLYARQV